MKQDTLSKYDRAQIKVASIKSFYHHVLLFVFINSMLFLFRHTFTIILVNKSFFGNPEFLEYLNWNEYGTTIIWGILLVVHGIKVFGTLSVHVGKWEERQIQKYMNSNNT